MWLVKRKERRGSADAAMVFGQQEKQLEEQVIERVRELGRASRALPPDWEARLERAYDFIIEANRIRSELRVGETGARGNIPELPSERRVSEFQQNTGPLRFTISSRFLRACWAELTGDSKGRERLFFVSGVVTANGMRIPSAIERVGYGDQSASFVSAKPEDVRYVLSELDRDGHELLGMWHSHINYNVEGVQPSTVDIDMQNRLLRSGSDSIGGIFNLDGHVRLFGTGRPLDVSVYGDNIEILRRDARDVVLKLKV